MRGQAAGRNLGDGLRTTREVLSEHLYSAVCHHVPHLADKVTGMLLECPDAAITAMLSDKQLLSCRVKDAVTALQQKGERVTLTLSDEKQRLGDELFEKVAEIESELCAQITGMLLEMDIPTLRPLLSDGPALEAAVGAARVEYLREHHPSLLPTREEFGEEIYEAVSAGNHGEHASRITGMLLELELGELQRLVDQPDLLKVKIDQAARAITSSAERDVTGAVTSTADT